MSNVEVKRMKHAVALFALIFVTACTTVQTPPVETPTARPSLSWRVEGRTSYEQKFPGLGFSQRYASASGWVDVYVYNLRRPNWKPGVSDAQFGPHFDSTIAEVREAERRGAYVGVKIGSAQDISIAGQPFRTVRFEYSSGGKPIHSTTYLTGRNGQLLKYRISIFAASGLDIDAVARQFIEENLRDDPSATKA
jgi:hypothetical protein